MLSRVVFVSLLSCFFQAAAQPTEDTAALFDRYFGARPARVIQEGNLPSRAEVEASIQRFEVGDFSNLPRAEEIAEFNERYAGGGECKPNPFSAKCAAFSEAYQIFFDENKYPSFHVTSYWHHYLLIPVKTESGVQTLFFDPTARQIYRGHEKSYFLGTKEELEAFHKEKVRKGEFSGLTSLGQQIPFEKTYFGNLEIRDNSGWYFEAAKTPTELKTLFENKTTELDKLEGRVDLYAKRRALWLADFENRSAVGKEALLDSIKSKVESRDQSRNAVRSKLSCREYLAP